MKHLVIGILVLPLLAVLAAVAFASGVVPGTRGCVWRSVDEQAYVRGNEAVLHFLPLSPQLRRAYSTTWTHAILAPNSCLKLENGPPYSAFITTKVFVRREGEPPLGFDPTTLGAGWVRQGGGLAREWSYRRGTALLIIDNSDEGVLLRVDHRAYAP